MALSPQLVSILVAVFVIILTAVLIFFWRQRRGARSGILMVGLNDSGKTLLFSRLVHSKFVNTYTSVKENIGDFACNKSTLKIVDIPGHERVRAKFFDQHKRNARGIVFLVDSANLQKDIRDVAEYLYSLLTDPVVNSTAPNFAIVCNKQDQTMAKSSAVVKKLLEKELNTLRKTKHNRLASLTESGEEPIFLGREDKEFDFDQLSSIKVDFIETTLYNPTNEETVEVEEMEEWLEMVAC